MGIYIRLPDNIDEKRAGKQVPPGSMEARSKTILKEIYHAAIRAVQPSTFLRKSLKLSGSALLVEGRQGRLRLPLRGKVFVAGAGKGADLTAPVWEALFGERLEGGLLLCRERSFRGRLRRISVAAGGHPLPDERSLAGTERCLRLLRRTRRGDWVIFFLMGGASSLLVKPPPCLTLEDKRRVTDLLLKSGMAVAEMNCIRKHLSAIKAGGILRHAYPARVLTLAISDVLGDDPTVIGSAPTFHDPTTYGDGWEILKKYRLLKQLPKNARDYLLRGIRGKIPETLKPDSGFSAQNPFVLLADNREALAAARDKAVSLGFATTILTSELSGDTVTKARELCSFLKRIKNGSHRRPHCFLLGGETTVQVRGKGKGGRNQEFALASAIALTGCSGLDLLSAGSDGSDGPTPAAGAFADGLTIFRARALGLDPQRALRNNDSYNFFNRLGELFCPGPTGTNVLDLKIVLLY